MPGTWQGSVVSVALGYESAQGAASDIWGHGLFATRLGVFFGLHHWGVDLVD